MDEDEVDEDEAVGVVGADGAELATLPLMGATVGVATAGVELTPRLPISKDPNGTPVRALPAGGVGDVEVGADDAAMLLEPEPHIPDNPEVSSIPEDVDTPDVAEIADDVDTPVDVPDIAAVAGVVVPAAIPIPPPS